MARMYSGSPYSSAACQPVPDLPAVRRRPRDSGTAHPGPRLLVAALGYLVALVLTCWVFLWTRAGQWLDGVLLPRAERGGGYEQPTVLVDPAKTMLATFDSPAVLTILLGSVLLAGLLGRRPLAGVVGVGMVLGAVAVADAVKSALSRPDYQIESSTAHNSFPSGHVTAATALLLAFMLVLPGWARRWLAVLGGAGVSVVASATMIAGWHRFSDSLGGVLLAAVLFCLTAAVLPSRRGGAEPGSAVDVRGGSGGGTALRGLAEAAGLLAVLCAVLLVVVPGLAASVERGPLVAIVTVTVSTVLAVGSVAFLVR
jgi:membrane-associated phospholipid phosphatase